VLFIVWCFVAVVRLDMRRRWVKLNIDWSGYYLVKYNNYRLIQLSVSYINMSRK